MKPQSLFLALFLAFGTVGSADAADAPPLPRDIYVRGGFNGWGTDHVLRYQGKGVYEALVEIGPGYHGFKIGSKDWADEWVINPTASVDVKPGTDYQLATQAGAEDHLFSKTTALYRFTVDASQPGAPVLRIARLEAPAQKATDPHPAGRSVTTLEYPTWDGRKEQVRFSADNAILRGYIQSTTMQLRDPGPQFVRYQEYADLPRVRSGNTAFDALFALATHEMKQDSVSRIADGNYNGGAPVPCECFETGEKWHYVWTRDLSYAANLGLAMLDPARVRNSLDFKLSGWRTGIVKAPQVAGSADGLQIIQDTGSGGSWPVSTDRVSWAFGAEAALENLAPAERKAFVPRALQALVNTIENDRVAAFDAVTGLYTGEESFLDWREQSYAAWIVDDIASMASSKALSTNVAHYKALTLASALARETGDSAHAQKYAQWAAQLKEAINTELWLADAGLYSSLTGPHFNGAPMYKFDWLGQALAIVTGVADDEQAAQILAHYPHGPIGPPVIYPQQPDRAVYHNRAIWPFVTAYGLRAAAMSGNTAVADAAYDSLMRGAALNLSNMENLEWLTGQPLLLDEYHPNLIGPVISSRRQLWSVGAYLGMVLNQVFGVRTSADGIDLDPFITSRLRRETFAGTNEIALENLRLHGKQVRVKIKLPAPSRQEGFYEVASISVNGAPTGDQIAWDKLGADNTIEIALGALQPGDTGIARVNADPYMEASTVFAPREPMVRDFGRDKAGHVHFNIASLSPGAVFNVYRDGELAAAKVPAGPWFDPAASATACYTVEAHYLSSGNASHHSAPQCADAGIEIGVTDARISASIKPTAPDARFDAPSIKGWGKPSDSFAVSGITVPKAGQYAVQVRYHNAANQINLGISGGVKWLAVRDSTGRAVAQGVIQLPHARLEKAHTPLVYSTPLMAQLTPGRAYTLELSDFYNMSYMQSNATFSAAGGTQGPSNTFDIYGVRLRAVTRTQSE
ncbi:esterase [Massilia arenosa]|uniref:Esterase n=1 Tax=Zemynaea arenosa TaxID=2561931 RepID=A0A4Y9SVL6_9BURK|nr:esterase [Massilia arenosa]TFW29389.1 esterase [Massilia arenosa]